MARCCWCQSCQAGQWALKPCVQGASHAHGPRLRYSCVLICIDSVKTGAELQTVWWFLDYRLSCINHFADDTRCICVAFNVPCACRSWKDESQVRHVHTNNFVCYFALGRWAMYCDQRVCLSVRVSKTTRTNFTKFSVHDTSGRGSVVFGQQFNTLCTSGFVDDVISRNGTNEP